MTPLAALAPVVVMVVVVVVAVQVSSPLSLPSLPHCNVGDAPVLLPVCS